MDLEKTMFLLSLINDSDFSNDIQYKDIIDFYVDDEKNIKFIIKKREEKLTFIEYTIIRNNNMITIIKDDNDDIKNYKIDFRYILNRYLAKVFLEEKVILTYEFDCDILTTDGISESNIIAINGRNLKNRKR